MSKIKEKYTCKCGAVSKEFNPSRRLGQIEKDSGFCLAMGNDTSIIPMCQKCGKEVKEHLEKIYEIVGTKNLYIPSLMDMKHV